MLQRASVDVTLTGFLPRMLYGTISSLPRGTGSVESINLMHTMLVMPDGREAIVPNGKVGSAATINYNRRGTRRFDFTIRIASRTPLAPR